VRARVVTHGQLAASLTCDTASGTVNAQLGVSHGCDAVSDCAMSDPLLGVSITCDTASGTVNGNSTCHAV
jgi:hypothetical protein